MSLICKKIGKFTNFFRNAMINKLNTFKPNEKITIFNPFQKSKLELSNYIHFYQNFRSLNFIDEIEMEKYLIKNIQETIQAKENFGKDNLITALKSTN
jgi:hypothetical protein